MIRFSDLDGIFEGMVDISSDNGRIELVFIIEQVDIQNRIAACLLIESWSYISIYRGLSKFEKINDSRVGGKVSIPKGTSVLVFLQEKLGEYMKFWEKEEKDNE